MKIQISIYAILFLLIGLAVQAQTKITGQVTDSNGLAIKDVRILVQPGAFKTTTNEDGRYELIIVANQTLTVKLSYQGIDRLSLRIRPIALNEILKRDFVISTINTIEVEVRDNDDQRPFLERIDVEKYQYIPNPSGGIEGQVKMLAGVSSNNELSSQYNVRGGNYDENLVYINDIEIYRPQLVRAGQQEGLSIINADLVSSLQFSAGGFNAKYGDKMSSVLDITYREPDSFYANVGLSLLGANAAIGDRAMNGKLSYIVGARYRTNRYLLTSIDVQADYRPSFYDAQAYLKYNFNEKWSISSLTYFGSNNYLSIPQSQQTTFGTATSVLRLNIAFDGRELLQFNTFLQAATLTYQPNKNNTLRWLNSYYNADESEKFDIIAQYSLNQLESDLASEDFGKVKFNLGNGGFLNHARNRLYANIFNTEIKGRHRYESWLDLEWGIKYQREVIADRLSEYRYIDSADYSLPQGDTSRSTLPVYEYIYSINNQSWNRYFAYAQNTFVVSNRLNAYMTTGVRANYWDYNKQLIVSPRFQFSVEPNLYYNTYMKRAGSADSDLRSNIRLKAAVGAYNQPPFYRELRNLQGILNPDIRSQRSIQYLIGSDLYFKRWKRPFKLTTEVYYKSLKDIIPYEVDNVRIRYFATNNAVGYATGIDFQLNGELVKDVPSWLSLSIMKTAENLNDDSYVETQSNGTVVTRYPGYIPRPTDQRVRASVFFQDYLPGNPTYRVHLQLVYGAGLPFGPPIHKRYLDTNRLTPYRRVDIGFSKMFYQEGISKKTNKLTKWTKSIWLSAEVFNAFGINNTLAYLWVKDVEGSDFGVPRYLTGRRFNIRLEVKF